MKTKVTEPNLFFVLSAIFCFTSCGLIDECYPPVERGRIAIILKLHMPGTQSTRASIETPVETSSAIVHKIDIYCYNKALGRVYFVESLTKDELTQATGSDGLIISPLDSNVDAIAIVANNTVVKNCSIEVNGSIYTLFDKELDINLEQDFDNITYFGKTENTIQIAPPEGERDDIDYFIASVNIEPVVARIELSDIACANFGTIWSNLHLNSIFVDNVYATVNLNRDDLSNVNRSLFQATEDDILSNNQTWWLEVLEGLNATNSITQIPWNPMVNTPPESGVFVFNIFPTANLLPKIGLYLDATVDQSTRTTITVNQYVRFSSYANDDVNYESFENGHIYKIEPVFTENNLTKFEDNYHDITLDITIREWTIYNNIIGSI